MRTRALRESDIPILEAMAGASGFPVVKLDSPTLEAVCVVVDDEDRPVMATAAERIVQLFLIAPKGGGDPAAKLHAIRLLHEGLRLKLSQQGYSEANVFLPPQIAGTFGRRLERTFGWAKNWPSWFLRF